MNAVLLDFYKLYPEMNHTLWRKQLFLDNITNCLFYCEKQLGFFRCSLSLNSKVSHFKELDKLL